MDLYSLFDHRKAAGHVEEKSPFLLDDVSAAFEILRQGRSRFISNKTRARCGAGSAAVNFAMRECARSTL